MRSASLQSADHFLDILDADMRRSGLPGNLAQIQLCLSSSPDRRVLEDRLVKWSMVEPACRVALERGFGQTRRRMGTVGTRPELCWHRNKDADAVLTSRMHTPMARPVLAPFVLDVIEGPDKTTLGLTWDHLLMDARGGEFLLARLSGRTANDAAVWKSAAPLSCWESIRASRILSPVFRRIGQGVIAPEMFPGPSRLSVSHFVVDEEESDRIALRARKIHPLIGETALLVAGVLRQTHSLCRKTGNTSRGYMIPVPVTRRAPGRSSPILGNPISFVYILADAGQMEDTTPDALARNIAGQFLNALKNRYVEACEKQLDLTGYLPRAAGRLILRRLMQGQLASCFFAHLGRTAFDAIPGFDFFGASVEHVFHQPMVCHPPGLGFFVCRHAAKLHLSVCRTGPESMKLAEQLVRDLLMV